MHQESTQTASFPGAGGLRPPGCEIVKASFGTAAARERHAAHTPI
jgi:hypothetical protein